MLKKERQEHIIKLLKEQKYCSVSMIANTLYVAPITVRRDLAEMEADGIINRCHGGATLNSSENREVPFELRTKENSSVKSILGKKAAEMLQDGDTVFMDASSTVLHIADYLQTKQNLTVITNSIKVLEKLKGKQITCYLTGGMLLENSHALVGNVAEETISSMYADICFFSSQGITEDGVITDFSDAETKLRKQMIRNAKKSIFLYDQSKVGKRFLFKVCDSNELFTMITNDDATEGPN
jgi:DeoR family fructose operon transcriptional repressor